MKKLSQIIRQPLLYKLEPIITRKILLKINRIVRQQILSSTNDVKNVIREELENKHFLFLQ